MSHTILELAYQLTQAGESFVLATVVWCERPTSAKPGAQAIVQSDGRITGWIGGSCAQPIVVREAMRMLREGGDPSLLRLGSSGPVNLVQSHVRVFPMTCTSGGVLDIYLEPYLPPPRLLLVGDSPIIAALSRLAPVLNFAVTCLTQADLSQVQINERTYILVATHGQYDEDVLEQALPSAATYVGMIASHRRADACRAYLRTSGMAEQHIARLSAPAGLDIGAVTPEEIAASILAELVQVQRRETAPVESSTIPATEELPESANPAEIAVDPVCGMRVEIASARYRSSYDSRDFFFCCPTCKRLFESNPQGYLLQMKGSS